MMSHPAKRMMSSRRLFCRGCTAARAKLPYVFHNTTQIQILGQRSLRFSLASLSFSLAFLFLSSSFAARFASLFSLACRSILCAFTLHFWLFRMLSIFLVCSRVILFLSTMDHGILFCPCAFLLLSAFLGCLARLNHHSCPVVWQKLMRYSASLVALPRIYRKCSCSKT